MTDVRPIIFSFFFLLLSANVHCQSHSVLPGATTEILGYVNPFIGTGGHGHTFPGATTPFGMVQLSPDTRLNGWDACSGYHSSDNIILGFSHTHLSGTGIGDYGDILLIPTTGIQKLKQGTSEIPDGYASRKTPGSETASPGYYKVNLQDYNITAELTATARAGMHRYTFPPTDLGGVILDVGHTLQSHHNEINLVEIVNDHEIRGHKITNGWAREHHVYFYAVFSKPFTVKFAVNETPVPGVTSVNQPGAKALLTFADIGAKELIVKVGISAVDMDGARGNVMTEIPGWDFDAVKNAAAIEWQKWLSRIEVSGGTTDQKTIFYTSLYHTAISPNLFTDADGRYRGMDKKIHHSEKGSNDYTVFSLWDTFRAFHPLMTIINPSKNQEWIRALLQKSDEMGVLPMWELSSNETGTMIGYNSVPVIVDSYMKNQRGFNTAKAFNAIKHATVYDTVTVHFPDQEVRNNLMPMGKYYNAQLGFLPADKENESVSKALEFAYDDWCIARMAKALGKKDDDKKFTERSQRYHRYFDKHLGFMRGVNSNGTWKTPFNPYFSNHREDEYVEGNAWQWSWFVPQDIPGLIALHDGRTNFILKLDSLFSVQSAIDGKNSSADISGLIGQYAHGNEPSHHIAYLYNYAGQPWKTQKIVNQILTTLYFNDTNGLSGNEDCGQMSAWYVLSSMGFYQVAPGDPTYTLGRPLFDKVTIHLENGKKFMISTSNNNAGNFYTAKATLNGKVLTTPFFKHEKIMNGGTLDFEMSSASNAATRQ